MRNKTSAVHIPKVHIDNYSKKSDTENGVGIDLVISALLSCESLTS